MRRRAFLAAMFSIVMALPAAAGELEDRKYSWGQFLICISRVETPNGENVGDDGAALGPFQIHEPFFDDAAEWARRKYPQNPFGFVYIDVGDELQGWWVSAIVMEYWFDRYAKPEMDRMKIGQATLRDFEVMARRFNGGQAGENTTATLNYWLKVRWDLQQLVNRET
jgi:hypothetical protein